MSNRLRTFVLLVILAMWSAVCVAYLLRDELPDAKLLAVPIGAIVALAKRGKDKDDNEEDGGDE